MSQAERTRDSSNRRLDSWKEIAAFFDRDERTVRRWEKERSLPVYRTPGKARGSVYAFTSELSQWLKSPEFRVEEPPPDGPNSDLQLPATLASAVPPAAPVTTHRVLNRIVATVVVLLLVIAAAWLVRSRSLSSASAKAPGTAHATSSEARDLYLKGRFEWSKRTPESLTRSVDYFTQAIVRDPRYAQAYAGLADSYNLLREYTVMPEREAYPRAIAAARRAVELDDSLSEAHRSLAFDSFYWTWDFTGAEREFKRAIDLNPKDAEAHHWYGTSLIPLGRFSEALSEIDIARQLDPSSSSILADRGMVLFYAGQEGEAISVLKQMEAADPAFLSPHRYLAIIAFSKQDFPSYLVESKKTAELAHDQARLEIVRGAKKAFALGGAKALLESLRGSQKKYHEQGLVSGFDLAETCALLGENKEAIHYLQEDFEKHDPHIIGVLYSTALRGLHNDPAFKDLVSHIGLPPF